jgi:hypothetical protein
MMASPGEIIFTKFGTDAPIQVPGHLAEVLALWRIYFEQREKMDREERLAFAATMQAAARPPLWIIPGADKKERE